jgi:hypothetical protein
MKRPTLIHTLDIEAANGTLFRALAIPSSIEGPNRHSAPAGRDDATVEFYDRRQNDPHFGEHGQYVASYNLRTLLGLPGGYGDRIGEGGVGLALHGGISAWTLDGRSAAVVADWLGLLYERGALD